MYYSYTFIYVLFSVFILFTFLLDKTFVQVKRYAIVRNEIRFTFLVVTVIFIAFRGLIGCDWINYSKYFNEVPSFFDNNSIIKLKDYCSTAFVEKGFLFYLYLFKSICNSYLFFQCINSIVDIIILHYLFKHYCSKNYYLCWCVFVIYSGLMGEFIILRNIKTILLFLISVKYIETKKPILYFGLNLIGFLLHTSSIIYFPLYFMLKMKRHKKIELFVFLLGIIIYFFQVSWLKTILQIVLKNSRYVSYFLDNKYGQATGITLGCFERICTFFLMYVYMDKIIAKDARMKVFWNLLLIYNFLFFYCCEVYVIAERLTVLFVVAYWFLFPKLYDVVDKNMKMLLLLFFFLYGSLKIVLCFNTFWSYYENILFNDVTMTSRNQIYLRGK